MESIVYLLESKDGERMTMFNDIDEAYESFKAMDGDVKMYSVICHEVDRELIMEKKENES